MRRQIKVSASRSGVAFRLFVSTLGLSAVPRGNVLVHVSKEVRISWGRIAVVMGVLVGAGVGIALLAG